MVPFHAPHVRLMSGPWLAGNTAATSANFISRALNTLIVDIDVMAREHDIKVNGKDFDIRPIRRIPDTGLELADKVASNLGLSARRIQTMAGHDSVAINTVAPSVMLFIPSMDGVSHCEREFSTDEDMAAGVDMLTGGARELVAGALAEASSEPAAALA